MPELVHGESEAEPRILAGLRWAVVLSAVILAVEAVGAFLSRSLSLTADAAHNVPDLVAFAISWIALKGTETGRSHQYTFGTHRHEVFAGLLNAGLIVAVGASFAATGLLALRSGAAFAGPVDPVWILVAVLPTLALRAANLALLGRIPARARDLNLRSVIVHLATDLAITVALLTAGVSLLLLPAARWADPAAAAVVGAILVAESVPLFRAGWEVLAERIPGNLSVGEVSAAALSVESVAEIHDIHIWAVCPTLVCLSAHVRVGEMSVRDSMSVVAKLRGTMEDRFGIVHAVFEVEAGPRS